MNNTVLDIGDATYFAADHHFGHRNMLAYENRPFADTAELRRALIERHNETVPVRGATVIFLGDYLLGERDDEDELRKITRQLHGDTKILLPGNHDRLPTERYERVFDRVVPKDASFSVRRGGREIGCVHSPMTIYSGIVPDADDLPSGYDMIRVVLEIDAPRIGGEWLCGHVHGVFRKLGPVVNAGVDVWDYRPAAIGDILATLDDPTVVIPGPKGFGV